MESARKLPWVRPRFVRRTSDVRRPHAFVRPGLSRARWDRVPRRAQLPLGTANPFGTVGAGSRWAPAVPGMPSAERGQATEWAAPRLEFAPPPQAERRVIARGAARRVEVSYGQAQGWGSSALAEACGSECAGGCFGRPGGVAQLVEQGTFNRILWVQSRRQRTTTGHGASTSRQGLLSRFALRRPVLGHSLGTPPLEIV
jgi:hypothetical protein